MSKRLTMLCCLISWCACAGSRPLDELLYDATRYANTPERLAAKSVAREELATRMPEAFHAAFAYAHGDNVMLQVLLMEWVQALDGEMITPALLEYLAHENEDTRRLALFFLGFKNTPEHAEKIYPHLENEHTRGAALRTLGKWRIAAARPVAERWLSEGRERVRVVAANALRDMDDPAAIPALTAALSDAVFTVRHAAARAILVLAGEDRSRIPDNAAAQRMLDRIRFEAGLREAGESFVVDGKFFAP